MLKIGSKDMKTMYIGDRKIKKAYLGSTLVYEEITEGWVLHEGGYIPVFTADDDNVNTGSKDGVSINYSCSVNDYLGLDYFYKAFDGNVTTYVDIPREKEATHCISVDFGKNIKPIEILLYFYDNCINTDGTLSISLSKDNITYDTVKTFTSSNSIIEIEEDAIGINEAQEDYRYLKIEWGLTNNTNMSVDKKFYELQVTKWYEEA